MPKFLVAIHHPENFDSSTEDESTIRDIDNLNAEMVAAGVRYVVGGLGAINTAKSLLAQPDGNVLVSDGLYLKTKEHVGGFWILDVADIDEALEWGRKAVIACRASVEVRPFFGSRSEAPSAPPKQGE